MRRATPYIRSLAGGYVVILTAPETMGIFLMPDGHLEVRSMGGVSPATGVGREALTDAQRDFLAVLELVYP